MPDTNQGQTKTKSSKILQYFRKFPGAFVEIALLIICTAVICIGLLYMSKYLWFIYTSSPVGEKYAGLFTESYKITNDILNRNFIRLGMMLTLTSFTICLIAGIVCKFFLITRYLYSSRGYLIRTVFFGAPLTYLVALYMHHAGEFSHIDTAVTVAIIPALCVFAGCFSLADEFVPDLMDIIHKFSGKADKSAQIDDTELNEHDFSERWKDYRKDIIIMLVIICAVGILTAALKFAGFDNIKDLAPGVSAEPKAAVAEPEAKKQPQAVTGAEEEWYKKALLLIDSKNRADYGNAIEQLDQAISLNPDYVDAYRLRGEYYTRLERYALAISDCDEIIRLKPKDGPAYDMRGVAYIASGSKETGCQSLRTACELGTCKGYTHAKNEGDCR